MHADDVSNLEDFGMIIQFLTEDGAADLLVGLISNLQAGAEVYGKKLCYIQISERQMWGYMYLLDRISCV